MRCSRRLRALIAATLTFVLVCPALPAHAASSSAAVAAQMKALSNQLRTAGESYLAAQNALEDNEYEIRRTDRQLAATQAKLAKAKKKLRNRASDIYRAGQVDFVSTLFEAKSLDAFMTRMAYFENIANADADVVAEVKGLTADLGRQKAALAKKNAAMKDILASRAARKRKLASQLASKQAEYARLKAQLAAALAKERKGRSSAPAVFRGSNGMVFPVAGANYYSDTWGAARSGGRSHKGTDIMASEGTPVVAVTDGDVSSKEGGLGGKVIWLSGSGWSFYYAHLSGWKVRSGSVRAGQVIGYVGATGNAAGGAPHLHFEMHPGGGGAVDPYPYLRAMQ